jgi:carbamoyl-phosphate synthase large subunit
MMLEHKTVVLVLGVGGNVSQGVLKALSISSLSCRVIGACITPFAFGLHTVDKAYISPRADDPSFLEWLLNICKTEGVEVVLSGVEPVLKVLAKYTGLIQEETGALCIVSDPDTMMIGNDKLVTCRWMENNGFNFPLYAEAHDKKSLEILVKGCGYPLIAKPRSGKGSQGLMEIRNDEDLAYVSRKPGYIVQECLNESGGEYTVGCFSDSMGKVRGVIVMRRELLAGTTVFAEIGEFPALQIEAKRIVETLRPMGPCNIQMRFPNGRPVCFEINIRFSGTTPIRARFGFNEVEAAIRHYIYGESTFDLPVVSQGMALRYWNELYIDRDAHRKLLRFNNLKNSKNNNSFIEDYGIKR